MNKSELIDAIASGADVSKASAGRALDSAIGAITGALKSGDSVSLVGFGTFSVKHRAARAGRNHSIRNSDAERRKWRLQKRGDSKDQRRH